MGLEEADNMQLRYCGDMGDYSRHISLAERMKPQKQRSLIIARIPRAENII